LSSILFNWREREKRGGERYYLINSKKREGGGWGEGGLPLPKSRRGKKKGGGDFSKRRKEKGNPVKGTSTMKEGRSFLEGKCGKKGIMTNSKKRKKGAALLLGGGRGKEREGERPKNPFVRIYLERGRREEKRGKVRPPVPAVGGRKKGGTKLKRDCVRVVSAGERKKGGPSKMGRREGRRQESRSTL